MKQFTIDIILGVLFYTSIIFGETIFAGSNTFAFPQMIAVTTPQLNPHTASFTVHGIDRYSHTISFSWNFSSRTSDSKGMLTIYSLLGQVVAQMPIQKHSGTVQWNISDSKCRNGLYLARINYGSTSQNLKLMLWN